MAQADDGMPQFKTSKEAPEVLDPKAGKYSVGLKIQDIAPGDVTSPDVKEDSFVSMQYVLRRANGYFVDASYGFDRFDTLDFKMGKGQMVPGVEQALLGMHKGGRRRFVVPPELGYTSGVGDNKPGPMPTGWGERRALDSHRREPLVFEVQVLKVK